MIGVGAVGRRGMERIRCRSVVWLLELINREAIRTILDIEDER